MYSHVPAGSLVAGLRWSLLETKCSENLGRLLAAMVPIFGASRYAWSDGFEKAFEWALFPLSGADGEIDYVIGIEDFSMIDRDRLERLLERQRGNDRHARPMAGSRVERPAFF